MRPERLYLEDMLEAAANVALHIGDREQSQFVGDLTSRAAVLHELTVIGEAAARLPAELRERHATVPWPDIVAFRNIIVHEYFGISWPLVWQTAITDVPELRKQVEIILGIEFPPS